MEALMFGSRRKTVIAKGLKIEGRVTAEGLVELNGQIEGELHGKSLIISRGALVKGAASADQVVVDGTNRGSDQRRGDHSQVPGACDRRYSPPISREWG
jgi:cytoskeletal protein CcmA (bactofilin family)